jgi:hypothetical protein
MIEEYYTGGLFLGPFNGVSDGSIVLYSFFTIGAFLGNDTFNLITFSNYNLRVTDIITFAIILLQIGNVSMW